jgi:hypothetical protein
MTNKMSTIFLGKVVEVIKDNDGVPTLELKVRVPTIHGSNYRTGVRDRDLPIAKPLVIPGLSYNSETFEEDVSKYKRVYIIFNQGDYNDPVYFGIATPRESYNAISSATYIRTFASVSAFPEEGSTAHIYRSLLTNALYYWDSEDTSYRSLINPSDALGDTLVGTVKVFTDTGPTYGSRVIDGIEVLNDDKDLVVGAIDVDNGIYTVSSGNWTKNKDVDDREVISVDDGRVYGGTMLRIDSGAVMIVKKSEKVKWAST